MEPVRQLIETALPLPTKGVVAYWQQSRRFDAIKLLCQLTRSVQQHRGATMAYLSGDDGFGALIVESQQRIESMLHILEALERSGHFSARSGELANLRREWRTIASGWHEDQLMHNFQFHCHLVENLKRSILECLQRLLEVLAGRGEEGERVALGRFLGLMFENIESLAMLRGLSISAAVIRTCGSESHTRLAFQLKEISRRNEALLELIGRLGLPYRCMPVVRIFRDQQLGLHKLLISIRMMILEEQSIAVDSRALFQLASEIIDAHWLAFDHGIYALESAICQHVIADYGV